MYLNDEKHPIIYFRYAIRRSTHTLKMVDEIVVYILYLKSRDKLSSKRTLLDLHLRILKFFLIIPNLLLALFSALLHTQRQIA